VGLPPYCTGPLNFIFVLRDLVRWGHLLHANTYFHCQRECKISDGFRWINACRAYGQLTGAVCTRIAQYTADKLDDACASRHIV